MHRNPTFLSRRRMWSATLPQRRMWSATFLWLRVGIVLMAVLLVTGGHSSRSALARATLAPSPAARVALALGPAHELASTTGPDESAATDSFAWLFEKVKRTIKQGQTLQQDYFEAVHQGGGPVDFQLPKHALNGIAVEFDPATGSVDVGNPTFRSDVSVVVSGTTPAGVTIVPIQIMWSMGQQQGMINVNYELTVEEGEPVSDDPDPDPEPEPEPEMCPTTIEGAFQPVQGVYQRDTYFPDMPGKQFTQISPAFHRAELKMVKDRPTLLMAINNEESIYMVIRGRTTGTQSMEARLRFTRTDDLGETLIYLTAPGELVENRLPIFPPCGPEQEFTLLLPAFRGIPPNAPFTFGTTGPYTIEAEIVAADGADQGKPTGLTIRVIGQTVATRGPEVFIVPIIFSGPGPQATRLLASARQLATMSAARIPDYFPLPPGGIKVVAQPVEFDSALSRGNYPNNWGTWLGEFLHLIPDDAQHRENLRELLVDRANTQSKLGSGERIVYFFNERDFREVFAVPDARLPQGYDAFAASQKAIFMMNTDLIVTEFPHLPTVLARELVRTLPYPTDISQLEAKCGASFSTARALGVRLLLDGQPHRELKDTILKLMNMEVFRDNTWITQCTYWHLLDQLIEPPDPPLILVRGRLAHQDNQFMGELLPTYQVDGIADLTAESSGDWAIVLRGASGEELGRFHFSPEWSLPSINESGEDIGVGGAREAAKRHVLAFAYLAPDVPGTHRIDLLEPGGAPIDSRVYSANAPTVAITAPLAGGALSPSPNDTVPVQWTGADADGDELLYSVFYAADGETWRGASFEQTETRFDLPVDPQGSSHRLRIVVTDGTQSSEATVEFTIDHRIFVPLIDSN